MIPDAASLSDAGVAPPPAGYPPCPSCRDGVLVTLHAGTAWVCTQPSCTYVISGNSHAITFHKGHAVTERKEKSGKRWVEFSF